MINKIRWYHAILHCRFWRHYICRSIIDHVHAHLLCASPHWRLSRLSTTYVLKKYFWIIAVLICRKAWAQLPCASITVRNLFFFSCPSGSRLLPACSGSNLAALVRYRLPFYVSRFRRDNISACVSIEVRSQSAAITSPASFLHTCRHAIKNRERARCKLCQVMVAKTVSVR